MAAEAAKRNYPGLQDLGSTAIQFGWVEVSSPKTSVPVDTFNTIGTYSLMMQ